jgi:hypothetical protein
MLKPLRLAFALLLTAGSARTGPMGIRPTR